MHIGSLKCITLIPRTNEWLQLLLTSFLSQLSQINKNHDEP